MEVVPGALEGWEGMRSSLRLKGRVNVGLDIMKKIWWLAIDVVGN